MRAGHLSGIRIPLIHSNAGHTFRSLLLVCYRTLLLVLGPVIVCYYVLLKKKIVCLYVDFIRVKSFVHKS